MFEVTQRLPSRTQESRSIQQVVTAVVGPVRKSSSDTNTPAFRTGNRLVARILKARRDLSYSPQATFSGQFESPSSPQRQSIEAMHQVLVTGANGQIGQELVEALVRRLGDRQVVRLDLDPPPETSGPFEVADVRDQESIEGIVAARDVEVIYHLASILSATGEEHPDRTWDVNVNGLKTILDVARKHDARVFWPSSIAVFGPATREDEAPQSAAMDPTTMYGVTKRSGELLCQYYHRRYGVDVRSLRYPGLVSYKIAPGGGTTDYAVEMFVQAARGSGYTCFLEAGTRLPMMYMPDAVRAALELMDASRGALSVHDSYNVSGVSFSPETLEAAIREHFPSFSCSFDSDHRQRIADDWPSSLDDRTAREDWGWAPEYGLDTMTEEMCNQLWEESGEREKA